MARKKKETEEVQWNGMPTDEATLKEIKGAVVGLYEQFHTIDEMKAEIKERFQTQVTKTSAGPLVEKRASGGEVSFLER